MGVIKKVGKSSLVVGFSEESLNSLGLRSDGSEPPTPPVPVDPVISETNNLFSVNRRCHNQLLHHLHHSRSHLGARKSRRADNARLLQALAEGYEDDLEEPTIYDFLPRQESAFGQLLNNFENMRVWEFFLTCTEEEQLDYLNTAVRNVTERQKRTLGVAFVGSQEKEEDGFLLIEREQDCCWVHPGNSGEQRFNKVEPNLRTALRRKQVPLGILSWLEDEIVELFCRDPMTVYVTGRLSSYERLLIHALCQYNLLHSHSVDIASMRRTKVENRSCNFKPPEVSLAKFLENKFPSP